MAGRAWGCGGGRTARSGAQQEWGLGCVRAGVQAGTVPVCAHAHSPCAALPPSLLGDMTDGGQIYPLLWVWWESRGRAIPLTSLRCPCDSFCPLYNCPYGVLAKLGEMNLGKGNQGHMV